MVEKGKLYYNCEGEGANFQVPLKAGYFFE